MRFKFFVCGLAFWLATALPSTSFETTAHSALVLDQKSGLVLLAKNETVPVHPASMSKLMTLNLLFEQLRDGQVMLDTKFTVSENASKKGGSKMFLRQGERVSVQDLIRGIIVHSGNDACIVVAENLAGTESNFARIMTARAREFGMMESTFTNATGWPDPNHLMSARDLITLANRLITQFPEYYKYFAEKSFTWDNITQPNRNPLLNLGIGVDGLKTGHTVDAGYGLVSSAKKGGRRVIMMINGIQSSSERAFEGERLMNWALYQFSEKTFFKAGDTVANAQVWLGKQRSVALTVANDVTVLVPNLSTNEFKATLSYIGPIHAPISKDRELGQLKVEIPELGSQYFPVYAATDVAKVGFINRLFATVSKLGGALR